MTYPYDSLTTAALSRLLTYYNGNNYNISTNPGGLGAGGHRTNFIPSLEDVALVNGSAADAASAASASAIAASSSASTAATMAIALNGTSATSVAIGTGAKSFVTQTLKSFEVGSFVQVVSSASSSNYMVGQVTSYNSGTGDLALSVSFSSGSGTHTDWLLYGRTGSPGATGPTGATGLTGDTPALKWLFSSSTADSDPGNGFLKLNSLTYSSVTFIYVDNLDSNGATQTTFLDAMDDSTNTALRGTILLEEIAAPGNYAVFNVTGAVTDGTGYRKVPVAFVMSNGIFTVGGSVAFVFSRTGNAGADGAGAGDVISDIASVTDGRIVVFNGTGGKHVTNASKGIGTSGANLGALDTANTWSADQAFTNITAAGTAIITSAAAQSFAVGRLGGTTPAFTVSSSTANQVTGLQVVGLGIGGGLSLNTVSSGTDEILTINAKGNGNIYLNNVATGDIIGRTAASGDNTTKTATTAYVIGEVSRPNLMPEGQFDIWQHGTTTVGTSNGGIVWTADRWRASRFGNAGAAMSASRQTAAASSGVKYKLRVGRTAANTNTTAIALYTALSSQDSIAVVGKTVTLSFYATAGANYSAASNILISRIVTGTGSDQSMDSVADLSWTGAAFNGQNNIISTTRTRFSHTFTTSSAATQFGLAFLYTPVGTAGAADYFEIDSLKVEIGACATPYIPVLVNDVLAHCYRYYEDMGYDPVAGTPWLTVPGIMFANGAGGGIGTDQNWLGSIRFHEKRNNAWTTALVVGATQSHITYCGGSSIYDLVFNNFNHPTTTSGLLTVHYVIDAGTHPALANGMPGAFALDGAATSSFYVSCEL